MVCHSGKGKIMRRFFVNPENVRAENIIIDNRNDLHHMIKVLRLSPGDEIEISDSQEWEYRARLVYLENGHAEAEILDKQRFTSEPETSITLFQGIPKQGKMELIVQKAVELGVSSIVPVFMKRTVSVDNGKFGKKTERWQKISDEAVKQCRRGLIPEVAEPVTVKEMTENFGNFDLVLFPYENEKAATIKDILRKTGGVFPKMKDAGNESGNIRIAVIIGPEGGFSDDEADEIVSAGGISVSLGKTVLRTETAGIAAIAMIMYEMEL